MYQRLFRIHLRTDITHIRTFRKVQNNPDKFNYYPMILSAKQQALFKEGTTF